MKKSESKNVYIYDIGEGLELLNICSKDPVSGKIMDGPAFKSLQIGIMLYLNGKKAISPLLKQWNRQT